MFFYEEFSMNKKVKSVKDKIYNKLDERKIKKAVSVVNNSVAKSRALIYKFIDASAQIFSDNGVSANVSLLVNPWLVPKNCGSALTAMSGKRKDADLAESRKDHEKLGKSSKDQ